MLVKLLIIALLFMYFAGMFVFYCWISQEIHRENRRFRTWILLCLWFLVVPYWILSSIIDMLKSDITEMHEK